MAFSKQSWSQAWRDEEKEILDLFDQISLGFQKSDGLSVKEMKKNKKEVKQIAKLPIAAPNLVDPLLLYDNNKLLEEAEIAAFRSSHLPRGHYQRKKEFSGLYRIDSAYSITSTGNGELYAHYNKKGKSVSLGAGAQGKVKLGQSLVSGDWVAAKIFKSKTAKNEDASMLNDSQYQAAAAELKVVQALGRDRSELIIRKSRKTGYLKYQFLMDLAKGRNLYFIIHQNELPLDPFTLLKIAFNLVAAEKALLALGYVHRDIKIENIMLDLQTEEVTLIDFGYALKMNKEHKANDRRHCGSLETTAPEVLRHSNSTVYSEATEVFAVGVVLEALLFGQVRRPTPAKEIPFKGLVSNVPVCQLSITEKNGNKELLVVSSDGGDYKLDYEIYEFIKTMTRRDPTKRPTLEQVSTLLQAHLAKLEVSPVPRELIAAPSLQAPSEVVSKSAPVEVVALGLFRATRVSKSEPALEELVAPVIRSRSLSPFLDEF